jgi:hypothetical protein
MKEDFLDYVDDKIKAMDDASSFVRAMNYDVFFKTRPQFKFESLTD